MGLGIVRNLADRAVFANEQHIERDKGILHPHGDWRLNGKIKQHAAIARQIAPKHQAARALFHRPHDLDLKGFRAVGCNNHQLFKG